MTVRSRRAPLPTGPHRVFGGYAPQALAALRSVAATSSEPSRTALPRLNKISLSAPAACSHRACSIRYASAASRVQISCSGAIWARSSSSAGVQPRGRAVDFLAHRVFDLVEVVRQHVIHVESSSQIGSDGADLMRMGFGWPRAASARCSGWSRAIRCRAAWSFTDSVFHRSTTSRNRVAATPPHTDGGTLVIRPMNACSIARISSLRASVLACDCRHELEVGVERSPCRSRHERPSVLSMRSRSSDVAAPHSGTDLRESFRTPRARTGSLDHKPPARAARGRARSGSRSRCARHRRSAPSTRPGARCAASRR